MPLTPDSSRLHILFHLGDIDGVRDELKDMEDINEYKTLQMNGIPIYVTIEKGDVDMINELVNLGLDVNKVIRDYGLPLHLAIKRGKIEMVKELLRHGADISMIDENGNKAIHFAESEMIDILIKHGADVNAVNNDGRTPLFHATYTGSNFRIITLLENGADINKRDVDGKTCIYHACEITRGYPHITSLKLLLLYGAEIPDTKDNWSSEVKELLMSYDSNFSLKWSIDVIGDLSYFHLKKIDELQSEQNSTERDLKRLINGLGKKVDDINTDSHADQEKIRILNLIKSDLEEKVRLLKTAVENGNMENSRLLREISILMEEIETMKKFTLPASPEKGFECVKPFRKSNATIRDRVNSCVPVEGGTFDNIRTADGGRFTNKQKCIEVCYTD